MHDQIGSDALVEEYIEGRELYVGVIGNDAPSDRSDNYPYGGSKASGLGREGVRSAMEELTEERVLVTRVR